MKDRTKSESRVSRRTFLKRTAGAGAVAGFPMIIPASALGLQGEVAPSERITLGHVGLGKMGWGLAKNFGGQSDVQVVACSDVEKGRLKTFRDFYQETLSKRLGQNRTKGVEAYEDYREMLARDDIDGVIVSSPDHWHSTMTIDACRAGKDVYCEKPLTHTVQEAYDIVTAVRCYGRVLQTGSMQRSSREFRFAVEMVRNGRIGKVHTINCAIGGAPSFVYDLCEQVQSSFNWDRWIGPSAYQPYHPRIAPVNWSKSGFPAWRYYSDFGGGGQSDWGAHMYDIAQWGLGRDGDSPVEVIPPVPDDPERKYMTYIYDDGVKMVRRSHTEISGIGGVEFIGDKGVIAVNRGKLATSPGHLKSEPTRADEEAVYNSGHHARDFLDCMRTRQKPICNEDVGASTAVICNLGNIAERIGESFKFDYERGATDNAEANRYLNPPKRSRYTI